ncbi:hypothetical protein LXL04_019946, partial [Taraxacum kok-saghyz]
MISSNGSGSASTKRARLAFVDLVVRFFSLSVITFDSVGIGDDKSDGSDTGVEIPDEKLAFSDLVLFSVMTLDSVGIGNDVSDDSDTRVEIAEEKVAFSDLVVSSFSLLFIT